MTAPQKGYNWLLAGAVLGGLLVVYLLRSQSYGTLEAAEAERVFADVLRMEAARGGENARVDLVAEDGEKAQTPVRLVREVRVIGCKKLESSGSFLPLKGRYGGTAPSHAVVSFECLAEAEGPEGMRFHLAGYVLHSSDPKDRRGGHEYRGRLLPVERVRPIMRSYGIVTRTFGSTEQTQLWARMAAHDIYVPADPSQTSPLKRAVDAHIKRISNGN